VAQGPKFIRFLWPIIAAIREMGGAARPSEVVDRVVDAVGITDDERAERTKSGTLRIDNQVHWARNYLVWAGLIDGSQRGRWKLTEAGWKLPLESLSHEEGYQLFKQVRADHKEAWANQQTEEAADPDNPPAPVDENEFSEVSLEASLRQAVLALSPSGFERLCKRLLTELGLEQLRTVGQAGDRGIDVEGQLRVNPVVSFKVGVQCKRYVEDNKVAPRLVRELQGALGPFDRGIFITTSVFTRQAEEQASAPGYKPIDLIDGERLLSLLIEKGLGIRTTTVVDQNFFSAIG